MNELYPSCPVCSGKFSAQEVFDFGDKDLDNQLCRKHMRDQLRMIRSPEE